VGEEILKPSGKDLSNHDLNSDSQLLNPSDQLQQSLLQVSKSPYHANTNALEGHYLSAADPMIPAVVIS